MTARIKYICKRDGRIVPFRPERVAQVVSSALRECGRRDSALAMDISAAILDSIAEDRGDRILTTQELDRSIQSILTSAGLGDAAFRLKAYSESREKLVTAIRVIAVDGDGLGLKHLGEGRSRSRAWDKHRFAAVLAERFDIGLDDSTALSREVERSIIASRLRSLTPTLLFELAGSAARKLRMKGPAHRLLSPAASVSPHGVTTPAGGVWVDCGPVMTTSIRAGEEPLLSVSEAIGCCVAESHSGAAEVVIRGLADALGKGNTEPEQLGRAVGLLAAAVLARPVRLVLDLGDLTADIWELLGALLRAVAECDPGQESRGSVELVARSVKVGPSIRVIKELQKMEPGSAVSGLFVGSASDAVRNGCTRLVLSAPFIFLPGGARTAELLTKARERIRELAAGSASGSLLLSLTGLDELTRLATGDYALGSPRSVEYAAAILKRFSEEAIASVGGASALELTAPCLARKALLANDKVERPQICAVASGDAYENGLVLPAGMLPPPASGAMSPFFAVARPNAVYHCAGSRSSDLQKLLAAVADTGRIPVSLVPGGSD